MVFIPLKVVKTNKQNQIRTHNGSPPGLNLHSQSLMKTVSWPLQPSSSEPLLYPEHRTAVLTAATAASAAAVTPSMRPVKSQAEPCLLMFGKRN